MEKLAAAQNNADERYNRNNDQDTNDIKSSTDSKPVLKGIPSANDEKSTGRSIAAKGTAEKDLASAEALKMPYRLMGLNEHFKTLVRMKYTEKLREKLREYRIRMRKHQLAMILKETLSTEKDNGFDSDNKHRQINPDDNVESKDSHLSDVHLLSKISKMISILDLILSHLKSKLNQISGK